MDDIIELGGLPAYEESFTHKADKRRMRTMCAADILNIDIEDLELSRTTTRFFLIESVYTVDDYIKRLDDFSSKYQIMESLLESPDFNKNETKNWALFYADIEMMTTLFEVGFWHKAQDEGNIIFPVDYYTLLMVPFNKLGIDLEYVSTLRRAGYKKLADLLDEDSGTVSSELIDEAVSSALHRLVRHGYISTKFANQIKYKRNSLMNPDKRTCNQYRQALVSISSYNDLEFENFKCPSVKCEGHCDILDDKIRTMLRKISSMEKSGQKLTIKDISLDSLTFFCSDIKRLEER